MGCKALSTMPGEPSLLPQTPGPSSCVKIQLPITSLCMKIQLVQCPDQGWMGRMQQREQRTSGQMCCLRAVWQGLWAGGGNFDFVFNPFSLQLEKLRLTGDSSCCCSEPGWHRSFFPELLTLNAGFAVPREARPRNRDSGRP